MQVGIVRQFSQVEVAVTELTFQFNRYGFDLSGIAIHRVERCQQFCFADDGGLDGFFQSLFDFIYGHQVQRVGHGQQESVGIIRQQQAAKAASDGFFQAEHDVVVQLKLAQLDKRNLQMFGQGFQQSIFRHQPHINQDAANFFTGVLLFLQGQLQLSVGYLSGLYEQIAEADTFASCTVVCG